MAALGLCCCARAFSSCGEQGLLFVAVRRLLIAVASLAAEHGLQTRGPQQLWLAGSRAQAQQLWRTGLAAPRQVGSSRTGARTHVPSIGRRIPNHCATREVPRVMFYSADKTEDLSLGHSVSDTLRDCSKEASGERAYIGVFATKTR